MSGVLLLLMLMGFVRPQTPDSVTATGSSSIYPPECTAIIENSSDESYPSTSEANSFNTFCPVFSDFADCLDRNRALLRNSSNPLIVILADHWNKTELKQRMSKVCTTLKEVSDDVECLKNASDITSCSTQTMSLLSNTSSLDDLCRYMEQINICYTNAVTGECPETVFKFLTAYLYVFVPVQCRVPNYLPAVVSGGPDSVIIACAEEIYPEILRRIYGTRQENSHMLSAGISRIIFESFRTICRNRTTFHRCVQERFKPPFMKLDSVIDRILNHVEIGYALDQFCQLELGSQEEKCLEESSKGIYFCSLTLVGSRNYHSGYSGRQTGSMDTMITTQNSVEPYHIEHICSLLKIVNKCVGIQLTRCSPSLYETFTNVNNRLLKTECLATELTKQQSAYPLTSVLPMCGYPLGAEIFSQFQKYSVNLTGIQISRVIRDLVPVACGYVDFYSTCVARELPKSLSTYDKAILQLFDITNAIRIKTVLNVVCDKTKVIQENIDCLHKSFVGSGLSMSCLNKEEYETGIFRKFENKSGIDLSTIREICSPLKEIGLCEANVMSNCSKDLVTAGKTLVLELLRTDCGGERSLTSGAKRFYFSLMLYIGLLLFSHLCKTF